MCSWPQSVYIGKHISLESFRGAPSSVPQALAKIRLQLPHFDKIVIVAVEPNLSDDIILGEDLGSDFLFHWIDIKLNPNLLSLRELKL